MMGPQARSSRPARTSVSEGELTDDQARQERVLRQRSRFLNSTLMMGKLTGGGEQSPAGRRRLAGGHQPVSNSLDRGVPAMEMSGRPGAPRATSSGGGVVEGRRQHSREGKRPAPQPPTQRVQRSSVDMLETSMSESESPRQEKVSGTCLLYNAVCIKITTEHSATKYSATLYYHCPHILYKYYVIYRIYRTV